MSTSSFVRIKSPTGRTISVPAKSARGSIDSIEDFDQDGDRMQRHLREGLLMFAQEKPPADRPTELIRKRMEPLVAAASGF